MKFFPNIFGKKINDIEKDVNGNYWLMHNEGAFTNNQELFWYSLNNPVLATVIASRAKLFSQMKIAHIDANGEEIKNSQYTKALSNPNYFQSQQDFLFNLMWQMSVFGQNYIYQNFTSIGSKPEFLFNLHNDSINFKDSLKIKKFIRKDQDIKEFEQKKLVYTICDDEKISIELKYIVPIYDLSNVKNFFKGTSRVKPLLQVLENIQENIKSKNINLKLSQKYIGVNKTDENGQPQIQEDDRENIRRALGANNIQITNGQIEFKHLISDFKKLYLDEMFQQDALTVINAFESNIDVINYALTNSTYNNQELGIIRYIQNSIQTSADDLMNSLSTSWKLTDRNEKLVASFNHLPVMQSMIKTKLETFKTAVETFKVAIESGLMTESEAKEKTNVLTKQLGL